MNIHKNARTTPQSRAEIVRRVVTLQQPARQVATAFGISERTVRKWVARARPSPAASLTDGSSPVRQSMPPRPQARTLTGRAARMSWARLLKRVFDIDVEHCPNCGGDLKIIAAIEDPPVILKILTHLGLPTRAPPRAPARRVDLFQTI